MVRVVVADGNVPNTGRLAQGDRLRRPVWRNSLAVVIGRESDAAGAPMLASELKRAGPGRRHQPTGGPHMITRSSRIGWFLASLLPLGACAPSADDRPESAASP